MKKLYFLLFTIFNFINLYSQVGIGTSTPNESAVLDVVSSDRGVLIPRLPLTSLTDATTIINGNEESLLVYNTNVTAELSMGYYYWSNSKWNRFTNQDDLAAFSVNASNGLNLLGGQIELGGTLNKPTEINTSTTNTLAITGLEVSASTTDKIIVVDDTTGELKTASPSLTNSVQTQAVFTAIQGQLQFATTFPITETNKINIFRNGVRVSFVAVGTNLIELEPEAICFENDEVRIVQIL